MPKMILAIDVHYREEGAKIVCAVLHQWHNPAANHHLVKYLSAVHDYVPGEFYKRELPCLLEILKEIDLCNVAFIIVDGFVVLDNDGEPGLGTYLYNALEPKVPVIGVAKNSFHQHSALVVPICRGNSKHPACFAETKANHATANNIGIYHNCLIYN
jgi:deoxyribonuclease V